MAKSFLEQLLDMTGLKWPDANGHYNPSVYRDEPGTVETEKGQRPASTAQPKKSVRKSDEAPKGSTELTGVARYLAKKYPEIKPVELQKHSTDTTALTGVAKYLARKQQEEEESAEAKAAALAKMTSVERYLSKLDSKRTEASEVAAPKEASPAKSSRVEAYLARQKQAVPVVSHAQANVSASETAVKEVKAAAEVEQENAAQQKTEKHSTPPVKAPSKLINLAESATQCQAATLKGTRCQRKTNLETIEKTINHQKYKFAVCTQHNNRDLTPFSELLQQS